eukprot:comp21302_c0_seq1/m.29119 comp21302_c0_seq1/g.29119  ORF comp21302_c0_seq1/g.29119 comp21302_c0_seq1/m.29119 type:complete len:204 (-) comp21302_c0_seq1:85-696(-)
MMYSWSGITKAAPRLVLCSGGRSTYPLVVRRWYSEKFASRLSVKMETQLVSQANRELFNSNTYLGMSFYFERENLPGFTKFLRHEADAERAHALKMFEYVQKRGGTSQILPSGEAVNNNWANAVEIFRSIMALERGNTDRLSELIDLAVMEKDHATHAFLQDFIKESVDEEDEAMSLYMMVQDYSSVRGLIHHMDKIIGKRAA